MISVSISKSTYYFTLYWNIKSIKFFWRGSIFELNFRSLSNGQQCFIEGTDLSKSTDKCSCVPDYYGPDCGIPDAVWFGHYSTRKKDRQKLKIRKVPRRIIHGVPVNHEFDFFEARIKSLADVVDAFIIQVKHFNLYSLLLQKSFLTKSFDRKKGVDHFIEN